MIRNLNYKTISNNILGLEANKQRAIYDFIKSELESNELNVSKIDTNLAEIINILSKENLSKIESDNSMKKDFDISKKISYNNLIGAKDIIEDYKIYHSKLKNIYDIYDIYGQNRSLSILQHIRKSYLKLIGNEKYDEDKIFFEIIEEIINIVKNSKNYEPMPFEELDMCVGVLVVDAFIRCKIFKNPEEFSENVITG